VAPVKGKNGQKTKKTPKHTTKKNPYEKNNKNTNKNNKRVNKLTQISTRRSRENRELIALPDPAITPSPSFFPPSSSLFLSRRQSAHHRLRGGSGAQEFSGAAVICGLGAWYFILEPAYSWALSWPEGSSRSGFYTLAAVSWLL
jgi:hypothetical protein